MVNANMFSEDELNPPEWINEEFFKRILDKTESESVKIDSLLFSPCTQNNEHYSSLLFRAKLKYALNSQPALDKFRSFVIKIEPLADGIKKDKIKEVPVFENEVAIYTEVLPKIEAELRAIGDTTVFSPKLLHYSLESPQFVVFDDLAAEGYATVNNRPCSLEEMKVALLKLAKFHAVSFKLAQTGNEVVTTFDKHFFNTVDIATFPVLRDGIKLTKTVLGNFADLQPYLPYIEKAERFLTPHIMETLNAYKKGRRSGVQVLNHGDFHMKNIMVKNVDNKLEEMMLLDYQSSIFGSPAIDLHYAFVMFYSPAMRREKADELLYYYTTNFQETLRNLKYQGHIPTIAEVRAEMQEHRHWGLYCLLTMMIFNYAFSEDSIGLSMLIESCEDRHAFFAKSKIVDELRILLPRFLHMGYFEE